MTGNSIFPQEVILGSDNGMKVVNIDESEYEHIILAQLTQKGNSRHSRKKSSKFPTPWFNNTSHKKTRMRRPRNENSLLNNLEIKNNNK